MAKDFPQNETVTFTLANLDTYQKVIWWNRYVEHYFQVVVQSLKFSGWLTEFEKRVESLIMKNSDIDFLEEIAKKVLTVIASDKKQISKLSEKVLKNHCLINFICSLACHYINWIISTKINSSVRLNIIPYVFSS